MTQNHNFVAAAALVAQPVRPMPGRLGERKRYYPQLFTLPIYAESLVLQKKVGSDNLGATNTIITRKKHEQPKLFFGVCFSQAFIFYDHSLHIKPLQIYTLPLPFCKRSLSLLLRH